MDRSEIRLEIVKVLLPVASRVGLVSGEIVDRADVLEKYVANGKKEEKEEIPDPITSNQVKKPKKDVAKEEKPVHTSNRKKHK